MRTACVIVVLLWASSAGAECLSDVQADVVTPLGSAHRFQTTLAPGDAVLRGRVVQRRGGETVRVDLQFRYRVPPDVIVFDEIICSIEVLVEDDAQNVLARSEIDPDSINLNPNRVPLSYATTLYTTAPGASAVRVRVRGNYE